MSAIKPLRIPARIDVYDMMRERGEVPWVLKQDRVTLGRFPTEGEAREFIARRERFRRPVGYGSV